MSSNECSTSWKKHLKWSLETAENKASIRIITHNTAMKPKTQTEIAASAKKSSFQLVMHTLILRKMNQKSLQLAASPLMKD